MTEPEPDAEPEGPPITDEEYRTILREGIKLWNEQKFFECHDKLEEAWKRVKHEKKAEPGSDPRRDFTHGLILLAVAFHHWRQKNPSGAVRKYDEATKLLKPYKGRFEGIDADLLLSVVAPKFEHLRKTPAHPFEGKSVPRLRGPPPASSPTP